jgi:hypothetical protein
VVNQYAPFYFWAEPAGMNEFLFGPGFAALSADFGRPQVRSMTGVAFWLGPDRTDRARTAIRVVTKLGAGEDLQALVDRAVREMDELAGTPGLHSCATLVDTRTWELVSFQLWASLAPPGHGDRYEILHLSTPHLARLPQGRTW